MRLVGHANRIGRDVGAVVALNTAGGIAGTIATGFLLVPTLGLVRSMGALACAAAIIGGIAITRAGGQRRFLLALAAVVSVSVALTAIRTPRDKFARLLATRHGGSLVFYEESPAGTVAVLEQDASTPFRRLYIQGVSNSGDAMPSLRYMRLQALLPVLIHNGEPRSVLVIGLGTGITAGALLADPSLEQRVCAELLPAVVRAADCFEGNFDVTRDPRMTLRFTDGRHELLGRTERYDVITLEPPPPSAAGVVNLYSCDFYDLCRGRLGPNGLVAQWLPLAAQNQEDAQSLVRSVLDVFPHVTLWTTELHETLLIASVEPVQLDVPRIRQRFSQGKIADVLGQVGVDSPVALLATYITHRDGLEEFAGNALPVTDDHPRIEYAPWVRDGEFARVLERVAELRSPVPLTGDDSVGEAVERERRQLWAFYRSAHYALTGQTDRWESLMRRLLPFVGSNPYYKWFIGQ
jgi:spermidine synthase